MNLSNSQIRNIRIIVLIVIISVCVAFIYFAKQGQRIFEHEVAKLSESLDAKISYDKADFDSQFFPKNVKITNIKIEKEHIISPIEVTSKEADLHISKSNFASLTAKDLVVTYKNSATEQKIIIKGDTVIKVAQQGKESFEIILADEIKLEDNVKTSSLIYNEKPEIFLAFGKNRDVELFKYQDNGSEIEYNYKSAEFAGSLDNKMKIDPVRIYYRKEKNDKAYVTGFEFSASAPKSEHDSEQIIDESPNLNAKQKKEFKSLAYFNNANLEIKLEYHKSKAEKTQNFIKIDKFLITSPNFEIDLKYRGGTIDLTNTFPNGSGDLLITNFKEFFNNVAESAIFASREAQKNSQDLNPQLYEILRSEFNENDIRDKIKFFIATLVDINKNGEKENLKLEFTSLPPFNIIINDKSLIDIIHIWDKHKDAEDEAEDNDKTNDSLAK